MKKKRTVEIQDGDDVRYNATAIITKGRYKGRFVFYDDDEGPAKAVVYLDGFPLGNYVEVPHKHLVVVRGLTDIYDAIFNADEEREFQRRKKSRAA